MFVELMSCSYASFVLGSLGHLGNRVGFTNDDAFAETDHGTLIGCGSCPAKPCGSGICRSLHPMQGE